MNERNWVGVAAVISLAGVIGAVGCSTKADDAQARTDATRGELKPPGNNGTVKIQELDATDEIPDNDPHVGCGFKIEFRGYDEGDYHATWTLSAQPPSGPFVPVKSGEVFIGGDAAGGANDLDGVVEIQAGSLDLSELYHHPQQGFHLKLEVHAEGSHGADVKHKVFWVDGCGSSSSSSGGSSSGGSSSGGSSGGSSSGGSSTSSSGSVPTW